jgi:hypothetical protein
MPVLIAVAVDGGICLYRRRWLDRTDPGRVGCRLRARLITGRSPTGDAFTLGRGRHVTDPETEAPEEVEPMSSDEAAAVVENDQALNEAGGNDGEDPAPDD